MDIVRARFTPAAVGSGETAVLYRIAQGERVVWASTKLHRPAAAASTATVTVGDGSDPDGFVTSDDLSLLSAAGSLANGRGAYLAAATGTYGALSDSGLRAGGKFYTSADTVDVIYTPGADPKTVAPVVAIALGVARDWPRG